MLMPAAAVAGAQPGLAAGLGEKHAEAKLDKARAGDGKRRVETPPTGSRTDTDGFSDKIMKLVRKRPPATRWRKRREERQDADIIDLATCSSAACSSRAGGGNRGQGQRKAGADARRVASRCPPRSRA